MSFFAILFALLIEQVRPLVRNNLMHASLRAWVGWTSHNFDTGKPYHGAWVWSLAVLLPALAVLVVHVLLLTQMGWFFAMLWSVAVLYVALGFRQFSHHFTDIRDALHAGDEVRARQQLAQWQQVDVADLPRSAMIGSVIATSVLSAHRHVFGVLAWFSILAAIGLGPAGAVLYRMADFATRHWPRGPAALASGASVAAQTHSGALGQVAHVAWHTIDWLPARMTALSFAVVGAFEEAIDAWRQQAQRNPDDNDGVILAATSGAVNVCLDAQPADAPAGREPQLAHLRSIVGLVWRSVVLWMVLLALLTLARLLG